MGAIKSGPKTTNAQNAFMGRGRMRRDIDSHHFLGPIKSRVTYFNGSMTWMKGKALVEYGEEELFCEFEGDPNLIERRFGGNVKRTREKAVEDDISNGGDVQMNEAHSEPKKSPHTEKMPHNQFDQEPQMTGPKPTPKRSRVSDPLGLCHGDLSQVLPQSLNEGPSRNTRSRASSSLRGKRGHRNSVTTSASRKAGADNARKIFTQKPAARKAKGKGKAVVGEFDQMAEITAGIDGFSVFSNHQMEDEPQALNLDLIGQSTSKLTDAGEWVHPVTHSAKVGVWLEKTAEAGTQASVDAPRSRAPSSIARII